MRHLQYVNVYFQADQQRELCAIADSRGVGVSTLIREAIEEKFGLKRTRSVGRPAGSKDAPGVQRPSRKRSILSGSGEKTDLDIQREKWSEQNRKNRAAADEKFGEFKTKQT